MEWALEIVLILLLAATLFHALRLERALGVLKRDRAALEELIASFNASTRQAEQGIERLRGTAEGAAQLLVRQTELAVGLKDDLTLLTERGEGLADRLDGLVRSSRAVPDKRPSPMPPIEPDSTEEIMPRLRSQAERDLLKALRMAR
jgi:hypothetical protein